MADLWRGMEAFFAGIGFAFSVRAVRARLWVALVVMAVVFVLAIVAGEFLASLLADQVVAAFGLSGWWDAAAKALAVALGLAFGFLLYWAFGPVALSPWLDAVCAASLRALGRKPRERGLVEGLRASWAALRWGLAGFVRWTLVSLLLWPVPVIGTLLAPLAWSVAGARLLAPELVEPAAAASGMDADALRRELEGRARFWLGFGLVASWMSVAPFVGQLVPVIGAAAATRALAGAARD